jgi:hypothetical protein
MEWRKYMVTVDGHIEFCWASNPGEAFAYWYIPGWGRQILVQEVPGG